MTAHCHHLFLFKHKVDKTHKKTTTKKNQEKGGSLPSHSYFALSLLALVSTFLLLHFHFKCFFLASYFFQAEENKKTQKKNHKKEKICREGRELTFKLLFCPLTFGSCFCSPNFALSFQALSLGIFFFSSGRKKRKTPEKKP
jgi:Na+/H+ antiporter NhaD/arsenite permease-like protein